MTEREIFIAATQIESPAERAAFLEKVCGQDAALRERICNLLAEQEQLGSFLEPPAAAVATVEHRIADVALGEQLGMKVGPYKLLQKLGEGGMGAVYLAEQQQPVKRQVALKVIKAGLDSAQVIARFDQERQALAIMDHPNIAKVLDAGTMGEKSEVRGQKSEGGVSQSLLTSDLRSLTSGTGRPYFVMELVKGIPITRYCDQEHLSPRERLELFIPVCHAIQHAHQKGIIHRDLKPSNVLIALYDGRPVPKVIDFGVAKATSQKLTERTLFTEVGSIVGTLEYMAPEQAELNNLDIDTRADIYSLGVLLYELLTGATPFSAKQLRAAGFQEMLRIIKEVEPPRPSTKLSSSAELPSIAANRHLEPTRLTKIVRGDLDWIVMKCLEKERSRRYETANAFALDIQRYLADEAVLASPPSRLYRLKKYARKHLTALSTAAAFALLLVFASILSTTLAIRARRAEKNAALERDAAARAAQQAKEEERRAVAAEADARRQRDAADVARQAEAAARMVAQQQRGQVEAINRFLLMEMLDSAAPEKALGRAITVKQVLDNAAARVNAAFLDNPELAAAVRHTIGETYRRLDELALAEPHLKAALETRQQRLGEEHPDTLLSLRAMGILRRNQKQLEEAETILRKTATLQEKTLGLEHAQTLETRNELGLALSWSHKYAEEELVARHTLENAQRALGPDHQVTLASLHETAYCLLTQGKQAEAITLEKELLLRQRRALGPDHPDTLGTLHDLALMLNIQGNLQESEQLLRECVAKMNRVLGPAHQSTIDTTRALTYVLDRQNKREEAEKLTKALLETCQNHRSPEDVVTLNVMSDLAGAYQATGRLSAASDLYRALLEARRRQLGPEHRQTLETLANLGSNSLQQRKYEEAEIFLRECLTGRQRTEPDLWTTFYSQSLLGSLFLRQALEKKPSDLVAAAACLAQAEPLLLAGYEGLKVRERKIPASRKKRLTDALQRLIDLYTAWDKPDKADKWRKELDAATKSPQETPN